jgi:hypothetical protein
LEVGQVEKVFSFVAVVENLGLGLKIVHLVLIFVFDVSEAVFNLS